MTTCTHCTGEFARLICPDCIVTSLLDSQHLANRDEARDLAARLLPDLFPEHPPGADLFERA